MVHRRSEGFSGKKRTVVRFCLKPDERMLLTFFRWPDQSPIPPFMKDHDCIVM